MSDSVQIPPEVLDVFRKIRAVVNAAVDYLETLQPSAAQLSADGTITVTGSLSATLPALTGHVEGRVSDAAPALPPIPTVEEMKMARAWLAALGAIGGTTAFIANLETLLQFAERILEALGLNP